MAKYLSGSNPLSPTETHLTWVDLAGEKDIFDRQMQNRWVYCFKKNGLMPYSEKQKQEPK